MDIKAMTKRVWESIFPIVKLEAIGTIKKEITEATNTTILELWDKVKPLFIEEFEELKTDVEDTDIQGAAKVKIRKGLEDEQLRKEIETLLQKIEKANQHPSSFNVNNENAQITNQFNNQNVHGDININ